MAIATVLLPCAVLVAYDGDTTTDLDPSVPIALPAVSTTSSAPRPGTTSMTTAPPAPTSSVAPAPTTTEAPLAAPSGEPPTELAAATGPAITYALIADGAGVAGIGSLDADGQLHELLAEPGAGDLDVTPDGRRLVFTVGGAVQSIAADGSDRRTIPGVAGMTYQGPRVSPDGTSLAVIARDAQGLHVELVGMDGANRRRLEPGFEPNQVDWSPDGTRLLLTGGFSEFIVLYDIATGATHPFVSVVRPYASPRWSPDGKRIAWTDGASVWLADVATGIPVPVASTLLDGAVDVAWTPDGHLLYTPAREGLGIRQLTVDGLVGAASVPCCRGPVTR